jgi:hypothetical protein
MPRTIKSLQQVIAHTAEQGRMPLHAALREVEDSHKLTEKEHSALWKRLGLIERERHCRWDDT